MTAARIGAACVACALLLLVSVGAASTVPETLAISSSPSPAYIETRDAQSLDFEFRIENRGALPARLDRVQMEIYDHAGNLVLRRDLDGSGASPANLTLEPDRTTEAGRTGLVFNPFSNFPLALDLAEIRYDLTFSVGDQSATRRVVVRPRIWKPQTDLILPLAGRVWVMHGHDFYSHHRRWNPGHPLAVKLGFTTIFARYALDLVPVDADNAMRSNHSNTNADFVGWGAPIAAPGDGLVVAAHDQEADDDIATGKSTFDPARLATEPLEFYGNYLIIDHGNGEFSLLGHLRQGSLTVKRGERVKRGQLVAAIGASGSAEFTPHLHYELRTGTTMSAEGLPAYFRGLTLLRGSAAQRIAIGPLNSGDFVIARP